MKSWITRRSTLCGISLSGEISFRGFNMARATARDTSESTPTSTWTRCDSQRAVPPYSLRHLENLLRLNILRQADPLLFPPQAVAQASGSSKRIPNSRVHTVILLAEQAARIPVLQPLQPRYSLRTATQRYQHAFGHQRNGVPSKLRRLRRRRRVRIYLASTLPFCQLALRWLPLRLLKRNYSLDPHRPSGPLQSSSSAYLAKDISHLLL